MQKTIIASLVGLAIQSSAFGAENLNLDELTVKANRFERKETETTYVSEYVVWLWKQGCATH